MADLSKLLGQRIKEIRKLKKMTQAQLAEAIGMETTNLCKLENGSHLPKEENIEKIASVFNTEIKDLFDFGHKRSSDYLKKELTNIINEANTQEIECFYRIITAIKEYNS